MQPRPDVRNARPGRHDDARRHGLDAGAELRRAGVRSRERR